MKTKIKWKLDGGHICATKGNKRVHIYWAVAPDRWLKEYHVKQNRKWVCVRAKNYKMTDFSTSDPVLISIKKVAERWLNEKLTDGGHKTL